jgi:hypothetical protein
MDRPEIRPTFSVRLTEDPNDAIEVMRGRLEDTDFQDCTRSKGRCAEFFVPEKERRVWSPYLTVQLERLGRGSLLRGRFGPHPEVWTLFMFLSFALGFLAVLGLMLGFVQWQSDMPTWGFWGSYLGVPGLVGLYLVSTVGQRLSAHQMEELRARLDPLLEGLEVSESD